ncbi:MAG: polymer-forming cytoskeletal protein [Desulfobacterales bacterium]|uniref:Polymer-forming cytoskeletal protein n=1 Tax=Candidatus Desulfatibia vada TaxID=2841696 RepID=A0A8J6NXX0_9BACT|nr:polymer-forming cytoskeletal protein [Candidatus Desulfatibia vada]MBL6971370.1 polymer-forming cytoskeletal protein [Desulfobacterales bacterium]
MRKSKKTDLISTYLGSDGIIEGTIEFQNAIRLDGSVKGKIFSKAGTVIIGETAVINARINVDIAVIMGTVNGTINARKRIEVYPPACVVGDIQAPTILIESGVMFNGNCSMKAQEISSKKPVSTTDSVQKFPIQKEGQKKTDSMHIAPHQKEGKTEADSIQKSPIPQEGQIEADSIAKPPVQKEGQAK